jgi:hypothetical protein
LAQPAFIAAAATPARLRLIATVHNPRVIRQILAHLALARSGRR